VRVGLACMVGRDDGRADRVRVVAGDDDSCTVRVSGPAEQGTFLLRMGIQARMQALLRSVRTAEQARGLVASYERLITPGDAGMGSIYKVHICRVHVEGEPVANPCGLCLVHAD